MPGRSTNLNPASGTVLLGALQQAAAFTLPLHLPAHGRGRGFPPALTALLRRPLGPLDLPELPSLGGPLLPHGAVAEAQQATARLWGSRCCWFGVNGSTGLLQAALLGALRPGQRLLCPRNLHRSVLHGAVLAGLEPVYYTLPFSRRWGLSRPVDVGWFQRVLAALTARNCSVDLVLLVNPTYQGLSAPLTPLVRLCHSRGLPVLVDEAHGSHFRAHAALPPDALAAGADLVVHSTHKSLPGLTQTAVLHSSGGRISREDLEQGLLLLQTSSPSALLLAATELAAAWPHQQPQASRLLSRALDRWSHWRQQLTRTGWLVSPSDDPLRLRLCTMPWGRSGLGLDERLLGLGIAGELPEPAGLTFYLGFRPPRRALGQLQNALGQLHWSPMNPPGLMEALQPAPTPLLARAAVPPRSAWFGPTRRLPLKQAVGQVVAEAITPYPPGIPLLLPGERLDEERYAWLLHHRYPGQHPGGMLDTVKVLR
ncbi:MAG: aminotransferase class I/II-fold pyridoxal phosphate-dependent enzyme [Cyanobacteria bacterium MAG IRC4_bin_6]|nr:aminotransferase class I/II-fold pyridoxal phosphate-dependent enzyme [Cyanobacteria bacterium MAG IRC3_bin_20]MDE0648304.1 aminotransferase class I/II-fold pyridoxal phosphate-dependent enzyme [Cyanobacteria bacterium MAG IRC4_bin_6]